MKLKFMGAAQTVTGSKTLLEINKTKYMVDCGMFQGAKEKRLLNWDCKVDAKEIEAVFLTHAHIDHSGMLPRLYKEGFRGAVYCSYGTRDLSEIMLRDAAHLQEEDAKFANETGYSNHKPALPLYTMADAEEVLKLFKPLGMDQWHVIDQNLSLRLTFSGHIIGSTFLEFSYQTEGSPKKITFSGDMGNGRSEIIKPPEHILETDFLVMESTYGDRLQPRLDVEEVLAVFLNTIIKRGGVAIIPAFAVGRTQEILYHVKRLQEKKMIPLVPVYVDSPMANAATKIFMSHQDQHRLQGESILPQSFHQVVSAEESRLLTVKEGPFIIISASGMLTGGRVMHHLKFRLPHKENGVIIVGYQAEETKGRLLLEGLKKLRIFHEEVEVKADIFALDHLSAHADYMDILKWMRELKRKPDCVFLNHGEKMGNINLKKLIDAEFEMKCHIPKMYEEFSLSAWEYS